MPSPVSILVIKRQINSPKSQLAMVIMNDKSPVQFLRKQLKLFNFREDSKESLWNWWLNRDISDSTRLYISLSIDTRTQNKIQKRMSTYTVNVNGAKVKTTVTDKASCVDSFITELILSCNFTNACPTMIGLDAEFSRSDDSVDWKAATLQLCSGTRCIIIQLKKMEAVPQSLINFQSAPLFCFVGIGISKFLEKLGRDYGLACRNAVDFLPIVNVAVLSGAVKVERKPLSVIFGDWNAENLSMEQIENAASDAHTSFKMGKLFLE